MRPSVIIVGPQGCGKTRNAPALAKAYGLERWGDAEELAREGQLPRHGCLILASEKPREASRWHRVVSFSDAMLRLKASGAR